MFIGVSGIIFTSANADKYFNFSIQPNAVTSTGKTFGGNIELPNVNCYVKVSTVGLDKNGEKVISSKDSNFFIKHPTTTFSLVDGISKSEITSFEITPKIRCEFLSGKYVPMTLQTANLKAFVMAKDSTNHEIEVWNGIKTGKDVPINFNHEEPITKFTVNSVDLYKYMEKGDYKTLLTFQVTGTLDFIYTNYNTVHYSITVPRDSVQTYIETTVTKDVPAQTSPDNNDRTLGSDPKSKGMGIEPITDDLTKLLSCGADVPCLTQQTFIPYYIAMIGAVFLIGAITTKNHPVFDSYGERLR